MSTHLSIISQNGAYRLLGPKVSLLTEHLITVFRIQPGSDLAWALAPEAPDCNHAALRYWVRIQLAEIALHPVDNLLVALEERLHRLLLDAFPGQGGELDLPSRRAQRSNFEKPFWEYTPECLPRTSQSRVVRRVSGADLSAPNVNPASFKEDSA